MGMGKQAPSGFVWNEVKRAATLTGVDLELKWHLGQTLHTRTGGR